MHSLRHFHATVLDPVISEAQKQAGSVGRPSRWPATTRTRCPRKIAARGGSRLAVLSRRLPISPMSGSGRVN